ncbi:MAG: Fic family protein [Candidatus Kapabacteria bacterium]|nr:Fic family protein [Candidatus Kapabacteria bacterium]
MIRVATGEFETTMVGGESTRAFVPRALPPIPPIDLDTDLHRRHELALLACGRLDGVAAILPDPSLFLYTYVRREAVLSSQIEGTQSSLYDLLLFELSEAPGVPFDDVEEVSNYVGALQHAIDRLQGGFPLSNRLIREVHEKLMTRARGSEKSPGEFRTSQNWIRGTRPGNAQFVPPPPHHILECMSALERFIHSTDTPVLIKAALAHRQFETIHPFLDGNGRTGRLLISMILYNENVMHQPLLYLSLYLKQHRSEYYRLLDHVRTSGDWEQWLRFFLDGVYETATGAVDTASRLLALFANDEQRLRSGGITTGSVYRVHSNLRARPVATIASVARAINVTYPTVTKAMEILTSMGIVREITGKQRNRVFVYDAYLGILNEGGG